MKRVLTPYHWLTDGDMSQSTVYSEETNVQNTDNIGISVSWTGTAVGTFAVEATIDGTNWSELDFGSTPAANGSADTHLLNINQVPFVSLRLKYVKTSGSGTLNSYITFRTVGA